MTTNVLVAFYSTYGHVHRMALAVAEGAESVPDTTVRLRRIAELEEARKALSAQDAYVRAQQAQADIPVVTHDDLRWADGITVDGGGARENARGLVLKLAFEPQATRSVHELFHLRASRGRRGRADGVQEAGAAPCSPATQDGASPCYPAWAARGRA